MLSETFGYCCFVILDCFWLPCIPRATCLPSRVLHVQRVESRLSPSRVLLITKSSYLFTEPSLTCYLSLITGSWLSRGFHHDHSSDLLILGSWLIRRFHHDHSSDLLIAGSWLSPWVSPWSLFWPTGCEKSIESWVSPCSFSWPYDYLSPITRWGSWPSRGFHHVHSSNLLIAGSWLSRGFHQVHSSDPTITRAILLPELSFCQSYPVTQVLLPMSSLF